MQLAAGCVVIVILVFLAGLHLYWAVGGLWGMQSAIPEMDGRPVFQPGPLACILVAVLLLLAGLCLFGRLLWHASARGWIFTLGSYGVATVFFLRTVGDFQHIGFFKKIRGTRFARRDTLVYSPLCLAISVLTLVAIG